MNLITRSRPAALARWLAPPAIFVVLTAGILRAATTTDAPTAAHSTAGRSTADRGSAGSTSPPPAGVAPLIDAQTLTNVHSTSSRCEACHTEDGWLPAAFAHERTGFQLEGAHSRALCAACHEEDFARAPPVTCQGCHKDAHASELGLVCAGCHTTSDWRPRFAVDAHRRTGFPLLGPHALLPCEECHQDRKNARFSRRASGCVDCHRPDYLRTAGTFFDHTRSRVTTNCRGCHEPTRFSPASYPQHEPCFRLVNSPHQNIRCSECHAPERPIVARGTCRTETTRCASCHAHDCDRSDDIHDDVRGYECKSEKCVGCHTR